MTSDSALGSIGRGLVLPVGLLLSWEIASHSGLVNRQFLPPLEHVGTSAWQELASGELVEALAASLRRDLLGFALGSSIGVLLGLLLGLSTIADRVVMTWFNGIKQIALLAWIPLISLWFGFDEMAKIAFIGLAAAIPVILNLVEGVRATSRKLIEVGEVFRFSRRQFILHLYLPAALPSLLTGLHLALIYAWLATIGAEYFMAAGPGIGGLIISGRERFDMDLVMLGILVVGSVGFLVDRGASWLERWLIPWGAASARV
ncbi:ABC transporter permease [Bradyrhizobium acaciae]|uniref:ABC transporter permease n=1 Tax=Bradyrhizobium acaciae TaxID=2683706 RepID=UPI001E45542F|nr:ABC transporter permease [Bradyrhizobium acaciae]MCC8978148.1 ABC transporter permease [Bradyrhizobium acaciae]